MARLSPADKLVRLVMTRDAWQRLRPNRSFAGLTFKQFERAIQPSLDTRAEIADLQKRLRIAITRRDQADFHSFRIRERVVFAVMGDPDETSNGELYVAMGYVAWSARGKRRRRKK